MLLLSNGNIKPLLWKLIQKNLLSDDPSHHSKFLQQDRRKSHATDSAKNSGTCRGNQHRGCSPTLKLPILSMIPEILKIV